MLRFFIPIALIKAALFPLPVFASVPEPSFVIQGQVKSSALPDSQIIKQNGMVISAIYQDHVLDQITLGADNNYFYTLEVPLEADVGNRGNGKARVKDRIEISIIGQKNPESILVTGRGELVKHNIVLPSDYDSDGDGVPNLMDVEPHNANAPVKYGNQDINGNGISNANMFLTNSYNPNEDVDGDGYSNQEEYDAGTDPALATSLPKQIPAPGQYAPLHVNVAAMRYLKNTSGNDLVWDETTLGRPVSLTPVYWDINKKLDYLIGTDKGNLYVLIQQDNNQFTKPAIVTLASMPTGEAFIVGMSNIDNTKATELWAYNRISQALYIYKRQPEGVPYGSKLWIKVDVPSIDGHIQITDMDKDGIVDVIASGVDLENEENKMNNIIAYYKGSWDGISYYVDTSAILITSQDYINNSQFNVIANINEAGFDQNQDIIIRADDQKLYVDLSFNSLIKGAKTDSLLQQVVTSPESQHAQLQPLATQLDTGSFDDVFVIANIDDDKNKTMDYLQYTGDLAEKKWRFRLTPGIKYTTDSDADSIVDYKDISPYNPNAPLPQGNIDFNGDGVPYGIDVITKIRDFDKDGMHDVFELTAGLDPLDASDAAIDQDNDGRTAFQESIDGTDPLNPYSVKKQKAELIHVVKAFDKGVSDLLIRTNDVIVASQNTATVKILDVNNPTKIKTLESTDNNGVAKILGTDDMIILGNVSGSIEVWDAGSMQRLIKFDRNKSSVTDMTLNGNTLFSLHADGNVYRWDLQTLTYLSKWKIYDGFLTNIYIKGDKAYIQASSPEKIMFVWNLKTQEQILTTTGDATCCEKVIITENNGNLLVAKSFDDKGLYSMNTDYLNSAELIADIDVTAIKVSGDTVYVGNKQGIIDQYSMIDGSFIETVVSPYTYVREIELTANGFISLHADGNIYFWEHK